MSDESLPSSMISGKRKWSVNYAINHLSFVHVHWTLFKRSQFLSLDDATISSLRILFQVGHAMADERSDFRVCSARLEFDCERSRDDQR